MHGILSRLLQTRSIGCWGCTTTRPSPLSLSPPLQVFVLVADPQGQILDSKEFLAPIITPHEALLAFDAVEGASQWDASKYRLDFEEVLEAEGLGEVRPGGWDEGALGLVVG